MHGNNVGTLNVYLIQNNIKTVKWRLKGQQNGVWNLGRLPAPRTSNSFSVCIDNLKKMKIKFIRPYKNRYVIPRHTLNIVIVNIICKP